MRRLKLIYISALVAIAGIMNAQTGLSVANPTTSFSADTLTTGQILHFNIVTYNTSLITYVGNIFYVMGVDTSGFGGSVPASIDSMQSFTLQNTTINSGDSIQFVDSAAMIINTNCRGGINTVVIWPVAASTTIATVDSVKHDLYMLDALGIRTVEKSPIIISPNPFSDKIALVGDLRNGLEQVRIINMCGVVVYENKSPGKTYIETSGLAQGVYYVELIFANGKRSVIKTIKQ